MLSQIVRPLVRTQIKLLANTRATRSTLIATIAQWLGYLGVQAQVTKLNALSGQIDVALTIGKPEGCDPKDWQQILQNLQQSEQGSHTPKLQYAEMTAKQQTQLQRLLAHLIQVGAPTNNPVNWDTLYPQIQTLALDEELLHGIKSALKVPQPLDHLLEGLDPNVAELALHQAVSIALLDQHVTPQEDNTLNALLKVME